MPRPPEAALITRSPHKLGRSDFEKLFKLVRVQPWLEKRQQELSDVLDICVSLKEQNLLCDLLFRFTYISEDTLSSSLVCMANQICKVWNCVPESTLIVAINRSSFSDSSEVIAWYLKPVLAEFGDWETHNFVSRMRDAVDRIAEGGSIILVDEFVGSGETLAGAISWIQEQLAASNKKAILYACTLASMIGSQAAVAAKDVAYFSSNWLSRGISDHYEGEELEEAKEHMGRLEAELEEQAGNRTLKKYFFGYKRTEALYYLNSGNSCNNVFPIFWWPELKGRKPRKPLLRRV